MGFRLTAHDQQRLKGVHPDLVKIIRHAADISPFPFKVTEGLRTVAQQRLNIKKGVSWTMNSRHLTGHAVDIVPMVDTNKDGKISTSEMYAWPLYYKLAVVVKQAAKAVGIPVEWGGDWRKNKDGPHWQLPFGKYPANRAAGFMQMSDADQYDVQLDEPTDPETDAGAATKSVAYAASAGATGFGIAADPVAALAQNLSAQQYEITSGDTIRIVFAIVIIGLGLYMAFHKAKGSGGSD